MLLTIGSATAFGLALPAVGLGGRRTDDHPLCRRCRFDLTGKPAEGTRCPECGADLGRPKAVVIGHRRGKPVVLAIGLGLTVGSLASTAAAGYGRVRRVKWLAHAPLWYVLREAASADVKRQSAALDLLRSREAGWSPAVWDRVVDAGLSHQADITEPWRDDWGDLIEDAKGAGRASNGRWQRYLDHALCERSTVAGRSRVGSGPTLSWEIKVPASRLTKYPFVSASGTYGFSPPPTPEANRFGVPGGGGNWCSGVAFDIGSRCHCSEEHRCQSTLDLTRYLVGRNYEVEVVVSRSVIDGAPRSGHPNVGFSQTLTVPFVVPPR